MGTGATINYITSPNLVTYKREWHITNKASVYTLEEYMNMKKRQRCVKFICLWPFLYPFD